MGRGSLWLSRENSLRKGQGLLSTVGEDDQGSSLLQSLQPTQQAQMSQRERKLLRKRKRKLQDQPLDLPPDLPHRLHQGQHQDLLQDPHQDQQQGQRQGQHQDLLQDQLKDPHQSLCQNQSSLQVDQRGQKFMSLMMLRSTKYCKTHVNLDEVNALLVQLLERVELV